MKYYEGCEEIAKEKTQDFQAKMKMGYEFKKAYAARRAWEFYNHQEVAGRCYVAVGGLDSITLRRPTGGNRKSIKEIRNGIKKATCAWC